MEAEALKAELQARLMECQLEMHPTKTRIVHCKVMPRRNVYQNIQFDFLGYCFRPRRVMRPSTQKVAGAFTPAVSPAAMKAMRAKIRDLDIRRRTQASLEDIARILNPLLRGWIEYYGRYSRSALYPLFRYVNQTLLGWARRKFKRYKAHTVRAARFLQRQARTSAKLFVHWQLGMVGGFA
jgi:hypothetical protein